MTEEISGDELFAVHSLGMYLATLDFALQRGFRMSLRIWKVLKATVDLGALTLGGYAMSLGAQPFPVIAVVALIISGPELFEWLVVRKHLEGYRDTYDRGYNEQVKERDELRRVLEDEQRQEEERSEGPDR